MRLQRSCPWLEKYKVCWLRGKKILRIQRTDRFIEATAVIFGQCFA